MPAPLACLRPLIGKTKDACQAFRTLYYWFRSSITHRGHAAACMCVLWVCVALETHRHVAMSASHTVGSFSIEVWLPCSESLIQVLG